VTNISLLPSSNSGVVSYQVTLALDQPVGASQRLSG
jgi:hypothetical protein